MAKIFLKWVTDLTVAFDPAIHAVLDEQFSLISLRQQENGAATGEIQFPNPGVGLLSASRRRFVLISESEDDDPMHAVLVARARILGMPTDFRADLITTKIICAPENLDEMLADAAEAHFALPYADPLYGDEARDPEAAIAARGCSWHIDPRTHEVTITDVLGGGPVVDIGHAHAGDFSIRPTEPPARKAKLKVTLGWQQSANGWVDIADKIGETATMSSVSAVAPSSSVAIATYYDALQPHYEFEPPDVEINGTGWTMGRNAFEITDESVVDVHFGWVQTAEYIGFVYSHSVMISSGTWRHYYDPLPDMESLSKKVEETRVWTYDWQQFVVSYQYQQARYEEIELELSIGCQDVMGAVSEVDMGELHLDDPTVDGITPVWYPGRPGVEGEAVQHDGKRWTYAYDHSLDYVYFYGYIDGVLTSVSTPGFEPADSIAALPDARSPGFVGGDRAEQAIEHALLLMRAKLRYGLRCLEATVRPDDWAVVRDITMADSLHADHPRFGSVTGKVISWERAWRGDEQGGGRVGTITIGAALGTGTDGVGDVLDVDYAVDADDVVEPVNASALGIADYVVMNVAKRNTAEDQLALVEDEMAAGNDPSPALSKASTEIAVTLRPLTSVSTIERQIRVTATCLESPMGYDAGAA